MTRGERRAVGRGRRRWLVGLVVALQVAVPASVLVRADVLPRRLGFQMYSATGSVDVDVRDPDGVRLPVDADLVAGFVRPDLDWRGAFPEYLCTRVPGAHTVRVVLPEGQGQRRVRCA